MTNLLEISKNNLKNVKSTYIIVLQIEIDTKSFTARLLNDKLEKTVKATSKVLSKELVTFFNI